MFEDLLINYWAVLGSAVFGVAAGLLWYSPMLFGKIWAQLSGCAAQEAGAGKKGAGMIKPLLGAFLNCLVMGFTLSFFLDRTGAYDVVEGLMVAGMLWVGFVVTLHFSSVLWERKPLSLFFIHVGHTAVFLAGASVIFMLWP